jgi:type II secretory ATPase GspE/PulE/Tfp pilus assembly ATPase PilB-like protein
MEDGIMTDHFIDATYAVRFLDELLFRAVNQGASDIHLESEAEGLRVRIRRDGKLYDETIITSLQAPVLIARTKVLSQLDVAERRLPQDGKFSVMMGATPIDIRVSTFPSVHGEKVVMRLLDKTRGCIQLERLGAHPAIIERIRSFVQRSYGFFLVSGPTGSGKTTTLYAILQELDSTSFNIMTLEDPVEYSILGVTQSQIHADIGFTFNRGLRSLLRQDPDIIMVGEVRDVETARIASQAALTGHLVLSTIHTNDAVSTVIRLLEMGIEPYIINASISGVLAQRLVLKRLILLQKSKSLSRFMNFLSKRCLKEKGVKSVAIRDTEAELVFLNYSA